MISNLRTIGFRWISGRLAHLGRQCYPLNFPISTAKGRGQTVDSVPIRSCLRHHSSVRPGRLRASQPSPTVRRTVKTLDSRALSLSDMVDFSGTKWPYVSFGGPRFTPLFYKVTGSVKGGTAEYHPFPPASKGFLYFHRKPGRESNIFSGEIRFRVVVNSSDSEFSADKLFADGHDLLDLSGLAPWRIHMVNLFVSKVYEPIRDLLAHQGFITSEQVSQGKRVVSETGWTRAPAQERILENMTDEFVLSFPPGRITLTFPRSDAIAQYVLSPCMGLYEKGLSDGSQSEPRQYHGNAIVRFELARVPLRKGGNEHIAMVLRVLRLPSPDQQGNPDGIPFHLPDGGELLQSSPGFVRGFKLKSASKHLPPSALELLERKYLPGNSL